MSHQIFFFSCFILVFFTSTDIVFHKFLELHSTLFVRKIFVTKFSLFLMDPLKPPPPPPPHSLNSQNQLSVTKVFCRYSLNIVMEPGKSKKKLLKGHFLCIKLIEIVPCISPGLFRSFFIQLALFIPKPYHFIIRG